jgi:hypothetical protein
MLNALAIKKASNSVQILAIKFKISRHLEEPKVNLML